ncbi:MAG TPA: hypothetical protein PLD92_06845, partial [Candidatus Omnitrophota bacterium]|nr:hypothetical protein [Candidatus Omnitrophota bacterium]
MFKKKIILFFAILILFISLDAPAWCGSFKLRWVEVDVVLDADGKAHVSYAVRWSCQGADLHGFYFEGFAGRPRFNDLDAHAVDEKGTRYPLDITFLSDRKYDIVLAGGQAFHDGEITYRFNYETDLQESGHVVLTESQDGRLVVFNWAPVQWSDALEHETVTVHYPVVMNTPEGSPEALSAVNFLTEKYVNQRYKIDYPAATNAQGNPVFTVRFHRDDLPSRYHFQIQTYLDAKYFNLTTMAASQPWAETPGFRKAEENYIFNRYFPGSVLAVVPLSAGGLLGLLLFGGVVLLVFPFFIMTRKHVSM